MDISSLQEDDILDWWPRVPKQELMDKTKRPLVVSFDLEATGLSPTARIIQLAAYCPKDSSVAVPSLGQEYNEECGECFNRYVLPDGDTEMEESARKKTMLNVSEMNGERILIDVRVGRTLHTVTEETALNDMLLWLRRRLAEEEEEQGVLLVSHGAIHLDIPLIFDAMHRHGLQDEFFSIVVGWCDSLAVFQAQSNSSLGRMLRNGRGSGRWFKGGFSFDSLFKEILDESPGESPIIRCRCGSGGVVANHRADSDTRCLHKLLCVYFKVKEVKLEKMPALQSFCFSMRCLKHYTLWRRFWMDKHWGKLWEFITHSSKSLPQTVTEKDIRFRNCVVPNLQKGQLIKLKNAVKNILSAGINLSSLESLWCYGGLQAVVRNIKKMKKERESYIADTWGVSAIEVGEYIATAMTVRDRMTAINESKNAGDNKLASHK